MCLALVGKISTDSQFFPNLCSYHKKQMRRNSSWNYNIIKPPPTFYSTKIFQYIFFILWDRSRSRYYTHNKDHLGLQKSSRRCLNTVTASAGCKKIIAQSCFRHSDVSLTCNRIWWGSESLYSYLSAMKSLHWFAGVCLSYESVAAVLC